MPDAVAGAAHDSGRRAFLLRRLHSLTGAFPVGVFLVVHLWTNASALGGPEPFRRAVGAIQQTSLLPVVEIGGVFLPLAFHAFYGVWLASLGKPNTRTYAFTRNWLYVLQRISGVVVLVFVLAHLWEYRVQKWLFGLSADAFHTQLTAHMSWTWVGVPWIAIGYLIGIAASVFHLANGLSTMTMTWGIATSRAGQQRASVAAYALGGLLFLVGSATVIGLATGSRLLPAADEGKSDPCGPPADPPPAAPEPASP